MYIFVEFYACTDSRGMYEELKKYNINVMDMGDGKVFAYGSNNTAEQIANTISVCNRYGKYSHISIDKGGDEFGEEKEENA